MSNVPSASLGEYFDITGGDIVSRGSVSRPRGVDPRPRNTNRRYRPSGSGSSSGGGGTATGTVIEDEYQHINNTDSMVYLNMNTDGAYVDTDYIDYNNNVDYNNIDDDDSNVNNSGQDDSDVHINGPGDHGDLETRFPSHIMVNENEEPAEAEGSEESTDIVIQGHDKPVGRTAVSEEDDTIQQLSLEDYVDLPASYNLMWCFIGVGIAFVTGVLVMVLYMQLDAENEGPTVKVLCLMIIVPAFFFFVTCGLNCYGRHLEIRQSKI